MLTILTGRQQTGKTRWLEKFVTLADEAGLVCKGLVSPGRWVEDAQSGLKKTGIDTLLLPEGERIPFADRRDLAPNVAGASRQADGAQLGWRIYDDAIAQVNAHFDAIARNGLEAQDVLVVDELGPLELERDEGFTSALDLLASPAAAQGVAGALVVVRPSLVRNAEERLAPTWGEPLRIDAPSDADYRGMESLISSFSSASVRS